MRRLRGSSDDALQSDRERLAAELSLVEARPTLEGAEKRAREWVAAVNAKIPRSAMLASIAAGAGLFDAGFIQDVKTTFDESFVEECQAAARDQLGAIAGDVRDGEIKRLRAEIDEADRELKKRGLERRRSELEAELAELAGAAGEAA